jgi:D-tyrosyl-tRNA(Tyr) deacylase
MRAVIQRVSEASVSVDSVISGSITSGLLVYLGVGNDDTIKDLEYIVRKVSSLRIFTDENGKMNRSIREESSQILLVSQFTLCAITTKGNRPSFNYAADPKIAKEYYLKAIELLEKENLEVKTGVFGASMRVSYTNEGPVTIWLDSKEIVK